MDKKEIKIQKALGTIERTKYRVSFVYIREGLPSKQFYYTKHVMAYSRDDATFKAWLAFTKDPKFKTDRWVSHPPRKIGEGFSVQRWDKSIKKKGAWVYIPS